MPPIIYDIIKNPTIAVMEVKLMSKSSAWIMMYIAGSILQCQTYTLNDIFAKIPMILYLNTLCAISVFNIVIIAG